MKLFQNIRNIIYYYKYKKIIKKAIQQEDLINKLNSLLGVHFKQDWVGRLYCVVNPYVQNLNTSGNTIIYNGYNEPVIEKWLYDNLLLIERFVANNFLFDLLTVDIKKVDNDLNYIIIIDNVMRQDYVHSAVVVSIITTVIAGITAAVAVLIPNLI